MIHTKDYFTKEVLEAYKKSQSSEFIKEIIHDAGTACVRRIINGYKSK